MQVKCPNCSWQPKAQSEWDCEYCGCTSNFFETAGRCPQCAEDKQSVYCIEWQGGCGVQSPLLNWYHTIDDGLSELGIGKLDH